MSNANSYTTADLLTTIRNQAHVPDNQSPFRDQDILGFANTELETALLRQILSVRENYYLAYTDTTVNTTGIYDIPTRAVGAAIADPQLVVQTTIYPISRTEISDQFSTIASPHGGYEYYFKGNQIVLPMVPTTGSLRMWYYRAPNKLVVSSSCAQITSIVGKVLTCTTVPTTYTTGYTFDLIKDQPHFDWHDIDLSATSVTTGTGGNVTLTNTPPTTLAVGDWIALSGQTSVPQIPVQFRALLAQRCVVKIQEIQGYLEKMKASQKKLEDMEKDIFGIISPRAKEGPKRFIPDPQLIAGAQYYKRFLAT